MCHGIFPHIKKGIFFPAKNILAADSAYWQAGYSQVLPRSSRAAFLYGLSAALWDRCRQHRYTYLHPEPCLPAQYFSPSILERFRKRKWLLAFVRILTNTINILGITFLPSLVHEKEQELSALSSSSRWQIPYRHFSAPAIPHGMRNF